MSYNGQDPTAGDSTADGSAYDGTYPWPSDTASVMTAETAETAGTAVTEESSLSSTSFLADTAWTDSVAQQQLVDEEQRAKNKAMHFNDFMSLPPYVANGEAFFNAHELPTGQTRLIREADFNRQATHALQTYNANINTNASASSASYNGSLNSKYPELIQYNKLGIPPPVIGHPVVAGSGNYANNTPPGPIRAWFSAKNAISPQCVYHNAEEGKRRHLAEQQQAQQDVQNHAAKLATLQSQLQTARKSNERSSLRKKIAERQVKLQNAQARVAAPFDGLVPFTHAEYMPADVKSAPPPVAQLKNPHRYRYDATTGHHVLRCSACGGQALVNDEQEVVQKCYCAGAPRS